MITPHTFAISEPERDRLVSLLHQQGAIRSLPVWSAFLTIPREVFVPFFYEDVRHQWQHAFIWRRVDAMLVGMQPYLRQVYRDLPLVTRIDEHLRPTCCCLRPSTLALLLEALDLHPGHHVLEVGTGTGYTTALLTLLAGHPRYVVSLDHDEQRTQWADRTLARVVGTGVTVTTGDEQEGDARRGPYDRIIVTSSQPSVPLSLVHQLALGGLLVLEKTHEGTRGFFRAESLRTTWMHKEQDITQADGPLFTHTSDHESLFLPMDHPYPAILSEPAFRWFLQWRFPGCRLLRTHIHHPTTGMLVEVFVLGDAQQQACVRFLQVDQQVRWQVQVSGDTAWWQQIQDAATTFRTLGSPQPHHYQLVVEEGREQLVTGSLTLPLLPA